MYAILRQLRLCEYMPSHLFIRVGSWDESSFERIPPARGCGGRSLTVRARDQRLHPDYLEYAYLQTGK